MPNYCKGYLSITCSEDTFEQIKDYVRSEESVFDFEKIIPMPENIYRGFLGSKEESLYGKDNWYDWSIENWGTKWNACEVSLDGYEYYFETAWSPCSPVIAALAKRFPEAVMRYTYSESGCCFCGVEEYHDGKLRYVLSGDYTEHNLDEEHEQLEWDIPESTLENPQIYRRNKLFLPIKSDDGKFGGKLYLKDWCDDSWGYEITALVAYEGEKPACWY